MDRQNTISMERPVFYLEGIRAAWEQEYGSRLPEFLAQKAEEGKIVLRSYTEKSLADPRFRNIFTPENAALVRQVAHEAATKHIDTLTLSYIAHLKGVDMQLMQKYDSDYSNLIHGTKVGSLAAVAAKDLKQPFSFMVAGYLGGLVHDVTKYDVDSDVIYAKNGLTDDQFRKITVHPVTAGKLMRRQCMYLREHPGIMNPDMSFVMWNKIIDVAETHHWNLKDSSPEQIAEFKRKNPSAYAPKLSYGRQRRPGEFPSPLTQIVSACDEDEAIITRKQSNRAPHTPWSAGVELALDTGYRVPGSQRLAKDPVIKIINYLPGKPSLDDLLEEQVA